MWSNATGVWVRLMNVMHMQQGTIGSPSICSAPMTPQQMAQQQQQKQQVMCKGQSRQQDNLIKAEDSLHNSNKCHRGIRKGYRKAQVLYTCSNK
ncbi:hypothetical protein OSTOST_06739 [Ostertagia ostertagi]